MGPPTVSAGRQYAHTRAPPGLIEPAVCWPPPHKKLASGEATALALLRASQDRSPTGLRTSWKSTRRPLYAGGTVPTALVAGEWEGRNKRHRTEGGWSEGIKEAIMERLQTMVRIPIQKGAELPMSSVPASWRDRCAQKIQKATGLAGARGAWVSPSGWASSAHSGKYHFFFPYAYV
jgi:hypothetical protein